MAWLLILLAFAAGFIVGAVVAAWTFALGIESALRRPAPRRPLRAIDGGRR